MDNKDFSDYVPRDYKACSVNGCERLMNARGMCRNHYQSAVTRAKRDKFMNIEKIKIDEKIEITFGKGVDDKTIYTITGKGRKVSTERKDDVDKIVRELLDQEQGE